MKQRAVRVALALAVSICVAAAQAPISGSDSPTSEALFQRGVQLAEAGRTVEAESAFQQVIEDRPDWPEAYNNLAVLQAAGGDFSAAAETLERALGTHPSYRIAYQNLSRIFERMASEAYGRALDAHEAGDSSAQRELPLELLPELGQPGRRNLGGGAPRTPSEPPAEAATPAADSAELIGVVQAWARSWSDQRVDDYLYFYARRFVPPDGQSRGEWERLRRDRISRPAFVKVGIVILDTEVTGTGAAAEWSVTFLQTYESSHFNDQVTKTLVLVRERREWKILRERVRL